MVFLSRLPISSRRALTIVTLIIWLLLMTILLVFSYDAERSDAFNRLGFKTETAFIQFERHWPDLKQESLAVKNHYLSQLTYSYHPTLHFSVITLKGKVVASSLNNLNQLSYGPVIQQFQLGFDQGQHCLLQLYNLQEKNVSACAYPYENEVLLIASLHKKDLLSYWLNKKLYLIFACIISLFLILIFIYLNYREAQHSKFSFQILKSNIKKQDDDFKRLVSNLPGILYRLRLSDRSLDYISPGSLQLLGYPPDYFLQHDHTPFDLIDEDDQENFKQKSKTAHFSLKPFEMVYRIKTASGEHKWILDRGRCYQVDNDEYFIEGVMLDITERELVRQQIEYLAIQDPLTELYNRFKFNDELVSAVSHAKMTNEKFAMLFIDLDRFKTINDSLGHQVGDRLLQKVAERLSCILPKQHFLARMGGDEFVVLMRNIENTSDIEILANDINRHVRQVFRVDSYELRTSCSIGISLCPNHSEHSHILWRYADTAMYQVKNRGGDGYQFFTQEMGDMVQHRINIEHGFIPAFESQQFELYYQPQVDIHNNSLLGCEALVRWFHPEMGNVSPVEFIPIAEETGFIHTLGGWILETSIQQLTSWLPKQPDFVMSVNISAVQVTDELPKRIEQLLAEYNVPSHALELEITESLLMENIDYILPILNKIKTLGVGFAIDDFGTGYSSLSYLRYLPINKLKIDRAFIMNIENNKDDISMVKAIVAMAKSLNLTVLAEGIENQNQLNLIKELSCERYQGYFFNKPLDANNFTSLYFQQQKQVQ